MTSPESLEGYLYSLAMDKCNGDEEQASWEARRELEVLADNGNEDAIQALSHKAW